VPYSHIPQQPRHVAGLEDIGEQPVTFLEIKPVLKACSDTGSVLAAVLKHRKTFVDDRAYWTTPEDANNTAHGSSLPA
jgi:hypothetical protein